MKLKSKLLLIVFLLIIGESYAQTYSSLRTVDSANPNWINLGTLSLPQGGNDGYLRIYGGTGYNASINQMGYVELHIRTSNGVNVDANGFALAASAVNYGRAGFAFISQIHIVPNNAGVAATAYTVYIYCGNYVGNSFYSVETVGGTWVSNNSIATTAPNGYIVPFEYLVQNNAYFDGQVGINTTDTKGYQFAVNGSLIATSVIVKANANWPDYVFTPTYKLLPLNEIKAYVDLNHHLPEIPSAQQIAANGLNLAGMDNLLIKKVEELTLYLIEKDKQLNAQQSQINAQFVINQQLTVQLKAQQEQLDHFKTELDTLLKQKK